MRVIKKMKGVPKSAVIMVKTEEVEDVKKPEATPDETANPTYSEETINDFYITNNMLQLIDELLSYDHITDPIERVDPKLVDIYAKIGRYIRQLFNNLYNYELNINHIYPKYIDTDIVNSNIDFVYNLLDKYKELKTVCKSSDSTKNDLQNVKELKKLINKRYGLTDPDNTINNTDCICDQCDNEDCKSICESYNEYIHNSNDHDDYNKVDELEESDHNYNNCVIKDCCEDHQKTNDIKNKRSYLDCKDYLCNECDEAEEDSDDNDDDERFNITLRIDHITQSKLKCMCKMLNYILECDDFKKSSNKER